jgi:TrmH family RNA methyltransferase
MLSQVEIKYLNSLKIKKYRNKYSLFIAEGDKIIKELIEEGLEVVHIYTIPDSMNSLTSSIQVTNAEMQKISSLKNHSNSLAVFKIPQHSQQFTSDEWIVMLDDIQDPGNMGTIIRNCDWFGIKQLICSEGCVDVYNPKVVQASMASIGRVQITETDLSGILNQYPFPVYGAVLDGINYHNQDFSEKGFILIGNEGHGIRKALAGKITYPVTIPKKGKAESLNAAIATALILDKLY